MVELLNITATKVYVSLERLPRQSMQSQSLVLIITLLTDQKCWWSSHPSHLHDGSLEALGLLLRCILWTGLLILPVTIDAALV